MIRVDIHKFDLNAPSKFWELNPQFRYLTPYSKLHDADDSKDHSYSSRAMWVIVFMLSPDEDENLFYRRGLDERRIAMEEFHPDLDWNDKIFKECYSKFPTDCLSTVEQGMLKIEQTIHDTVKLISETEQTLDRTEIVRNDRSGEPRTVTIKGTALQINTLRKDIEKGVASLERLKSKYLKEKHKIKAKGDTTIHKGQDKSFWQL